VISIFSLRADRRGINLASGQHCPSNACQLIGHRDNRDVLGRSCFELIEPFTEAVLVTFYSRYHSARAMHEELPQVRVASLAYAQKSGLAASGMLARNQAEPRRQITRFRKSRYRFRSPP
jgi:hypothetical protein